MHLHGADKPRRAQPGKLLARQRVGADGLNPLLMVFGRLFLVIDTGDRVARGGEGFQVFAAEDRAHTGPARRPSAAHHRGIAHQVFPGGADDSHAAAHRLAVGGVQRFLQRVLRLGDFQAPKPGSVVEAEFSVFDLDPGRAFASTAQDQRVEAGLLQIVAEVAAAVGGGGDPRQRGEGGDVEAVGRRRPRAGQRARGDHDQVLGIEGRLLPGQIVIENLGGHGLAADILFPVKVGPDIVFSLSRAQIQQRHPAHIAAIVCHPNPS